MQLLAKVLNDEINLIVSHDLLSCYHFATQLGSTHSCQVNSAASTRKPYVSRVFDPTGHRMYTGFVPRNKLKLTGL